MRKELLIGLLVAVSLLHSTSLFARTEFDLRDPDSGIFYRPTATSNMQFDQHKIGKIALVVTNYGTIGTGYVNSPIIDGKEVLACEYPYNSGLEYLFAGGLWIGAVVGRDTLVSVAADGWSGNREIFPDVGELGAIIRRSSLKGRDTYSPLAISEQDVICTYSDTNITEAGTDGNDNRPHRPINVSIQQNSYAWSYDYAEDFIIMDFKITNIGRFPIDSMYIGLYVDADVSHRSTSQSGYTDDICGIRRTVTTPSGFCIPEDTVNIAYIADNDGDPVSPQSWGYQSITGVTGTRVLRTPNPNLKHAFNWWVSNGDAGLDFGPRLAGTEEDPYRPFGAHRGTPTGDRNKYYIMRHNEFDYDQIFTAISHAKDGFEPPPRADLAGPIADGFDTRYLISVGPFNVDPGKTLPITLSYLGGENLHVNPGDFDTYYDQDNPSDFYNKLNFTDFGLNARWASWIFDNPGYDTDNDGDSGIFCWKFIWCDSTVENPADTFICDSSKFYYMGDYFSALYGSDDNFDIEKAEKKIDLRGATPPPPPAVSVAPSFGKVVIRWNGQVSENAVDVFSGIKDFEGYKVYCSEGDQATDYILLASFDLDDFKIYEFDPVRLAWNQVGAPLTRDSLRALYGDDFEPERYDRQERQLYDMAADKFRYFVRQDWNQSDLTNPDGIHRVYPDASKDDPTDTTDEGFLRYYEYEYNLPNLEPGKPYYFAVTVFDFGSLKVDLGALESSPLINAVREYPLPTADEVEEQALAVTVFPNPYRIDGGYARIGYENRDRLKAAERSRKINFANLPKVCTIRIYTVDGDLVDIIEHNRPEGGPGSQVETWNVISRNTQAVVTGVYLWHVESEMGEQVGKLVIIK